MIMSLSLSSRRAWIEMLIITPGNKGEIGRSPHGERGLKSKSKPAVGTLTVGRSPHGERGLKYNIKAHTNIAT